MVSTLQKFIFILSLNHSASIFSSPARLAGLLTTIITESPLKNILLTYLSLFTAVPLFFPFPPFDVSVHISLTSSSNLGITNVCFFKKRKEYVVSTNVLQKTLRLQPDVCCLQIHVSIIGLYPSQELVVVSYIHKNLCIATDCLV